MGMISIHKSAVRERLDSHLERIKIELSKRKQFRQYKGDYYKDYFTLSKKETGGIDFNVEADRVEEQMNRSGYFLLFSNDMGASPDNLLFHYRAKDSVEKLFAQIKVEMEGNRIRTHNEATTSGKTFITFIAGIIRTALLVELSQFLNAHSTSLKKVFTQLENIEIRTTGDKKLFRNALTKKQKEILKVFNLDKEIISSLEEL